MPTPAPTALAQPDKLDLLIFGATGDLSIRKLLPALFMAFTHDRLPPDTRIYGLGRQAMQRDEYVAQVLQASRAFIDEAELQDEVWARFVALFDYVPLDASQAADYARLASRTRSGAQRVFYLATAPSLFAGICEHLAGCGLVDAQARVVLEKPLGHDLASARAINQQVGRHFAEHQIYRIDHYLGKETVQNLMVLRFGNSIFEPIWRAGHIRSVQITVAEAVGVGSRAGFYDGTGCLRDMVQNHLLQLLAIVAMEPPVSLDADAIRDEKLKVLKSLRRIGPAELQRDVVRGQYTGGNMDGKPVPGYLQEANVPANSQTETFVALRTYIDSWRWANVPFFLRTGKRMAERKSEIVIEFANQPFNIFPDAYHQPVNRLVITLQPEESVQLQIMAKEPGSGMKRRPVTLDLDLHTAFTERRAEAYERLLMDVIRGRLTHFMRHDELEAAWSWAEPILNGWQDLGEAPRPYAAGTWGPAASSALTARTDMQWAEEA